MDDIMDFTVERPEIKFRIDDDVFTAYPALPAMVVLEFSTRSAAIDTEDDDDVARVELLKSLELVLTPQSYARFVERLSSYAEPIDLEQVKAILPKLMEKYGLRPTEPSSSSSPGEPNPDGGTNSTDDTPVVVSTSGV